MSPLTPRACGIASLGLLAAYAAAVLLTAAKSGTAFDAVELFRLGGAGGDGGSVVRVVALALGLVLGWGVPGLSLAFLFAKPPDGAAAIGRALGLGFGYIFATGAAYAAVFGHAPGRAALLVLLALPCAWQVFRTPAADARSGAALKHALAALAAMALLAAVLWPNLRHAALNGDGTEVYELARSLDSHAFPRWDLESAEPGGRFGIPVVVPFFTGAFLTHGEMTVLGRGELAARLPFVFSLILAVIAAMGLARTRDFSGWIYAAGTAAVYALWHAYYVTYEPSFPELAASAASDTLMTALFLAGFRELAAGSPPLGVGFIALASGTTFAAPVLGLLAVVFLRLQAPALGREELRWSTLAAAVVFPAILLLGWHTGDWPHWLRQLRVEYADDFTSAVRVPFSPLAGKLLLMTGALPLAIPLAWRGLRGSDRALFLAGAAYLAVVFAGAHKSLHYLAPLPWIFLAPALDASSRRGRLAAAALLVAVFALSVPGDRTVRRENIELGRESCVQGLSYEAAALGADPVYEALGRPPGDGRFAVGKHTFVRYAADLGGRDCVVGLSAVPPPGAVRLAGDATTVWTADPERYARWRHLRVPAPSSVLFPRPAPEAGR